MVLNKWDLYIQDCRFPREDNSGNLEARKFWKNCDQPLLSSRSQRWGNTKIHRKRPLKDSNFYRKMYLHKLVSHSIIFLSLNSGWWNHQITLFWALFLRSGLGSTTAGWRGFGGLDGLVFGNHLTPRSSLEMIMKTIWFGASESSAKSFSRTDFFFVCVFAVNCFRPMASSHQSSLVRFT